MSRVCHNCLAVGARPIDVGPDKGTQRDPFRASVPLCSTCEAALLDGNFMALHERYVEERVLLRGELD